MNQNHDYAGTMGTFCLRSPLMVRAINEGKGSLACGDWPLQACIADRPLRDRASCRYEFRRRPSPLEELVHSGHPRNSRMPGMTTLPGFPPSAGASFASESIRSSTVRFLCLSTQITPSWKRIASATLSPSRSFARKAISKVSIRLSVRFYPLASLTPLSRQPGPLGVFADACPSPQISRWRPRAQSLPFRALRSRQVLVCSRSSALRLLELR